MNDHQVATATRQNSAYRHRNYEGRFRKRRRPSTFCDKNMSVGANGLADLEKKIRFHVPVLSRRGFSSLQLGTLASNHYSASVRFSNYESYEESLSVIISFRHGSHCSTGPGPEPGQVQWRGRRYSHWFSKYHGANRRSRWPDLSDPRPCSRREAGRKDPTRRPGPPSRLWQ